MIVDMKLLWKPEIQKVEIDENEIVYALKENFCKAYNASELALSKQVKPDRIKLSYKGKQIVNHEILSECGVVEGERVMVSRF